VAAFVTTLAWQAPCSAVSRDGLKPFGSKKRYDNFEKAEWDATVFNGCYGHLLSALEKQGELDDCIGYSI